MEELMKIFGAILFASTILTSCGPSACDCANIRENQRARRESYSPKQINDKNFLRKETDIDIKKAKQCTLKFGDLGDFEKELVRSATGIMWIPKYDKAIEKAKSECAK